MKSADHYLTVGDSLFASLESSLLLMYDRLIIHILKEHDFIDVLSANLDKLQTGIFYIYENSQFKPDERDW